MIAFDYEKYLTFWTLQDMIAEEPKEGEIRADDTLSKSLWCYTKLGVKKGNVHLTILLGRDFVCKGVVNYFIVNVIKTETNNHLGSNIRNYTGEDALTAIEQL